MFFGLTTDDHYDPLGTDGAWPGAGTPYEWRAILTAEARFKACLTYMETIRVSTGVLFLATLGDVVNGSATGANLATMMGWLNTGAYWAGDFQAVVGNHECSAYASDMDDYTNNIVNATQDDVFVTDFYTNNLNLAYSFDAGGIHFVCLGATGPDYDLLTEVTTGRLQSVWLAANLAATSLPVVVFTHYHLYINRPDRTYQYITQHAAIRTILENAGNVQAVFQGHYHHGDIVDYGSGIGAAVINDIPYYSLRGAVLALNAADTAANAYYLVEIRPESVYTASGMKANIEITGFGAASSKSFETHAAM